MEISMYNLNVPISRDRMELDGIQWCCYICVNVNFMQHLLSLAFAQKQSEILLYDHDLTLIYYRSTMNIDL